MFLHRGIEVVEIAGRACLLMAYHEDQGVIVETLSELEEKHGKAFVEGLVGFGHLSVNGALQNASGSPLRGSVLTTKKFEGLKRTFSGM